MEGQRSLVGSRRVLEDPVRFESVWRVHEGSERICNVLWVLLLSHRVWKGQRGSKKICEGP